jgi:aspartyl-tRNA(Asn)/glutamyl-tRNA(Gln) amidotransferase subunit B
LTGERTLSDYFEQAVQAYGGDPKRVSNWVMNDVLRLINDRNVPAEKLRITPEYLGEIIKLVDSGRINTSTGKSLVEKVEDTNQSPDEIVTAEGLGVVSDDAALRGIISEVIEANPEQVSTYQGGKTTIIGWFVGQVMKKSRGKADPQLTRSILEELLSK